jgi:glucose/arabinose dehydrogenase
VIAAERFRESAFFPSPCREESLSMSHFSLPVLAVLLLAGAALADGPTLRTGPPVPLKPMITGLKNPESVAIGPDRRVYITVIGDFDKDGDGGVMVVQDGKAIPFATGLDDPKGMVSFGDYLFVADKKRIWRIDRKGKAEVYVAADKFPRTPLFLNDIESDGKGTLYVSDSGDLKGGGGAVFRIDPKRNVTVLVDADRNKAIHTPNGVLMASEYHLHLLDFGSGALHRIRLSDGAMVKVADGFDGGDGVCRDHFGRLYLSSWKNGKVFVIPRPGQAPVLLADGFQSAADICLSADGKSILVPDMQAGTLTAVPAIVPGGEVDVRPLPVTLELAFPDLEWTGWKRSVAGKVVPHRPLVLTHANDDSNRVFVATQHGVIHVFPNDQKARTAGIFLDIQDRVSYSDSQNEEGFLGLAFSPGYRKNGEFYVYYTSKQRQGTRKQLTNVLSRFRVSKGDPDRADPKSEEILIRFEKPFWNHDGGTVCFGPDGHLYVAIGDGGDANDPLENGQNLGTLLGKILRLDVDHHDAGLPYAIPKDNPFVGRKGARGEIWAYGLRNVWRMSFDRKTGELWAADVGQNLWEEINLITRGGNYGWNLREGLHPFGVKGVEPRKDLIEPIWEYHHDVGKSITGGHVYRGKRVPALEGLYLHGDYVTGLIWGLRHDGEKKRVTANHVLRPGGFPVYSFGEDDKGEVYVLTSTGNGKGIYRFAQAKE